MHHNYEYVHSSFCWERLQLQSSHDLSTLIWMTERVKRTFSFRTLRPNLIEVCPRAFAGVCCYCCCCCSRCCVRTIYNLIIQLDRRWNKKTFAAHEFSLFKTDAMILFARRARFLFVPTLILTMRKLTVLQSILFLFVLFFFLHFIFCKEWMKKKNSFDCVDI